ncbi:MAG TPA: aminoacyl-histidine dipeptidase [Thermoanaerobaculia bacterium]|nr:aminoacyl-histidine dipeptidase [Thermoanaerobaculia bacterium]
MTFVADLEPTALWSHFDHILTVPRGSGNEAAMRDYVLSVAARRGCAHRGDEAGNLVVTVPASPGREGAPVVVLQSHLDMVEEKNSGTAHDFTRDPIRPVRDGEVLRADGTTLGADNGIGVAAMLAVLEGEGPHGPLELLFTIDEERGLAGAQRLDPSLVSGKVLINLDSEEEGTVIVGCAGGADTRLALPLHREEPGEGTSGAELRISGLSGGHSGVDIHLQRGNALKVLARALHAARLTVPFHLAALSGGDKGNAIPREASALVVGETGALALLGSRLEAELAAIRSEVAPADPGLAWSWEPRPLPPSCWTEVTTWTVLRLLEALPHGVQAMSIDLPGLVETSCNLASVKEDGDLLRIFLSNRSSIAGALAALRRRNRAAGSLAGAEVTEGSGYPGWKPDVASPVLTVVRRAHQRVLGTAPQVTAIHAGLECGVIGEKVPGLDMVSIGPTIRFPHSPNELVEIETVGRFYRLLTGVLEDLAAST